MMYRRQKPWPSPEPVVTGIGGCTPHERRVARIAVRLFDLLADLHGLGKPHRRVLRVAALLHDLAKPEGNAGHAARGAAEIRAHPALKLTRPARSAVAFLVRHHCGKPPRARACAGVPESDMKALRTLLGLLRAADGLDSRRASASSIVVRRKGRRLRVRVVAERRVSKLRRAIRRKSKFDLLERGLRLRVRIRIVRARGGVVLLA